MVVKREFKAPAGINYPTEVDANGDGEVMVLLDLRMDEGLQLLGIARDIVNRFQKLRKKAGLMVRHHQLPWFFF